MAQIWLTHDQDLCVSSIWAGDWVLGTLVTNWAQPRSFSPKPSSTSQRCIELWDRNLKSLKCGHFGHKVGTAQELSSTAVLHLSAL